MRRFGGGLFSATFGAEFCFGWKGRSTLHAGRRTGGLAEGAAALRAEGELRVDQCAAAAFDAFAAFVEAEDIAFVIA